MSILYNNYFFVTLLCIIFSLCVQKVCSDDGAIKVSYSNKVLSVIEQFIRERYNAGLLFKNSNIDDAVEKIQKALDHSHPSEQLTRGEILDLLQSLSQKSQYNIVQAFKQNSFKNKQSDSSTNIVIPMADKFDNKINIDYSNLFTNENPVETSSDNAQTFVNIPENMKYILSKMRLDRPVRYSSKYTTKPLPTTVSYTRNDLVYGNIKDLFENIKTADQPLKKQTAEKVITKVFDQSAPDVKSYKGFKPLKSFRLPEEKDIRNLLISFGLDKRSNKNKERTARFLNKSNITSSENFQNTMKEIINSLKDINDGEKKINMRSKKVKRDQNSIETTTVVTTFSDEPPESSITTESPPEVASPEVSSSDSEVLDESTKTRLADLEASFGGIPGEFQSTSTQKPKSGFFYFVNWNTFVRVGEDDDPFEKKVDLKFNPKKGNPNRFLPSLL